MRVEIDTHTHTLASGHAYNTLNEMAQAAADKGLKGLAITEHAPEMPGTCHLFYFQNLRIVPRKKYGIELLLGTELNIMNAQGETDLPDSVLERLDIAIASIHMPCFKDERTIDNVTAAYEKVMEHPYVDIIGHPDDGRFPVDMKRLVKKAKETGTLTDVYSLVHEISHTLYVQNQFGEARMILGEVIPQCMERMLDGYLIELDGRKGFDVDIDTLKENIIKRRISTAIDLSLIHI